MFCTEQMSIERGVTLRFWVSLTSPGHSIDGTENKKKNLSRVTGVWINSFHLERWLPDRPLKANQSRGLLPRSVRRLTVQAGIPRWVPRCPRLRNCPVPNCRLPDSDLEVWWCTPPAHSRLSVHLHMPEWEDIIKIIRHFVLALLVISNLLPHWTLLFNVVWQFEWLVQNTNRKLLLSRVTPLMWGRGRGSGRVMC